MMQTADQLSDTTARLFGVSRADLIGTNRTARVAQARHALAWALRRNDWSLEAIGDYLRRDHTTIIYALARIERDAARDPRLAERLAVLDTSEIDVEWRAVAAEQAAEIDRLRAHIRELEGTRA
jgi:chromosomal replication initiation ATPase DnaA